MMDFPSRHGDKEYACSPDLPGRVVKCDKRTGRGSLLRSLSKEPDCNSLCHYTRSLNSLTTPPPLLELLEEMLDININQMWHDLFSEVTVLIGIQIVRERTSDIY